MESGRRAPLLTRPVAATGTQKKLNEEKTKSKQGSSQKLFRPPKVIGPNDIILNSYNQQEIKTEEEVLKVESDVPDISELSVEQQQTGWSGISPQSIPVVKEESHGNSNGDDNQEIIFSVTEEVDLPVDGDEDLLSVSSRNSKKGLSGDCTGCVELRKVLEEMNERISKLEKERARDRDFGRKSVETTESETQTSMVEIVETLAESPSTATPHLREDDHDSDAEAPAEALNPQMQSHEMQGAPAVPRRKIGKYLCSQDGVILKRKRLATIPSSKTIPKRKINGPPPLNKRNKNHQNNSKNSSTEASPNSSKQTTSKRENSLISYFCGVCSKSFKTKYDLSRHHSVEHLKERPFQCVVCAKRFTSSPHLKRHDLLHLNVKTCTCIFCERPFRDQGELNRHLCRHIKEKPYSCDLCGFSCPTKYELKVHCQRHTRDNKFQ